MAVRIENAHKAVHFNTRVSASPTLEGRKVAAFECAFILYLCVDEFYCAGRSSPRKMPWTWTCEAGRRMGACCELAGRSSTSWPKR